MANKENRGRDIAIFNFTGSLVADAEVRINRQEICNLYSCFSDIQSGSCKLL